MFNKLNTLFNKGAVAEHIKNIKYGILLTIIIVISTIILNIALLCLSILAWLNSHLNR